MEGNKRHTCRSTAFRSLPTLCTYIGTYLQMFMFLENIEYYVYTHCVYVGYRLHKYLI